MSNTPDSNDVYADPVESFTNTELAIALSVCVGTVALVVTVVIIITVCRRRRRRKEFDFEFDDLNGFLTTSKSAPISRNHSPRLQKRGSCPDVMKESRGVLVRSITINNIPDFALPLEHIQPRSPNNTDDPGRSFSYQYGCPGSLKLDLYRNVLGTADDALLPPSDQGRVWFSITYDAAVEHLSVTLIKVKELQGRGKADAMRDPFVKIFLLPDESSSRMSKIRKKTLSPVYNETFVFQVPLSRLPECSVRFSVYDVDKRRVRHSLGHAVVPLKEIDVVNGDTTWRDLEASPQVSPGMGEIQFSLTYISNKDKIKIAVLGARHVMNKYDFDKEFGMYMVVRFNQGRNVLRTKKTSTKRESSAPVFNESMSFSVAGRLLESCSITFTLVAVGASTFSRDVELGQVSIGSFMFARGEELVHWQEMLHDPGKTVTKWHVMTTPSAPLQTS